MYLPNALPQDLATLRSTTLVNSSITALSFNLLAKSTLNFSPVDNTWYGFNQLGILLKPTADNLSTASSCVAKWEQTA